VKEECMIWFLVSTPICPTYTPEINTEHKNHHIEKENHLPNLHSASHVNFSGCTYQL